MPSLHNETELLQQEAESNDPSIIWPSKFVLEQLPDDWLPERRGVVHNDNGRHTVDTSNATNKNTNHSTRKRKSKNIQERQDKNSSINFHDKPQNQARPSLSQPYYLNHVRGSTRLRQATQRLAAGMGTACATYLLCNPSLPLSFSKFDDVGLQTISFHRVLHDIIIGILIGVTIVLVLFVVEVYMGWIRVVGYWEKVVAEECFALNLLWDVLFHVGVSVNEELM